MVRQDNEGGGDPARGAAVHLLDKVLIEGRMMSAALEAQDGPLAALDGAGRARAQRLCSATLRHVARADAVLAPHLRKPPPAHVRNILRLAVVEMLQEGAPAHGAVNAAVSLTRSGPRGTALAGLVNAVLRKVAAADPAREWAEMPPQRLPGWLRKRLVADWGRGVVPAIEAAHMVPSPLDLTVRADADGWAQRLDATLLPTGSLRLRPETAVSALPGYDDGAWWVQDAAAALPARLLAPGPGAQVLDLCAAPGGKTLQLAATGAEVTALDMSPPRMRRLRANLARTRLRAETVVADALEWQPARLFDAVLLDAPCSATGTIRRHPDLPFVRGPEDLEKLTRLQAALIARAAQFLRPGGRLVYCTCSLLRQEGEGQIRTLLAGDLPLRVDPQPFALPGVEAAWHTREGGLRLRPDYWNERGGMDGFYMIRLVKVGAGGCA